MTDVRRVALIHTVASLVPHFRGLTAELLPDLATFDIVDETLLRDATTDGGVTLGTARRLFGHLADAQDQGADAVLVTCSSMGGAVDAARPFARVPVLRIDQAMAEQAVSRGARIGILATLRSTLEPTGTLIRAVAAEAGRSVEVRERVVDGAFDALREGNLRHHDQLVAGAVRDLVAWADVIVLAQASMARAIDAVGAEASTVPILTSPRLGVERLRDVVRGG